MFVEHLLRSTTEPEGARILDLCAAPGGKATLYSTLAGGDGIVIANEVIRSRALILADNIRKWGIGNTMVTNNDPAHFAGLGEWFDAVAVDAPCSGEGMFRKSPEARGEWSEANVRLCAARQRRIVSDAWAALRPGGVLIYSTCTYNTREDEENIAWIRQEFGAEPLPLTVPEEWNITGGLLVGADAPVYRFLPHKTQGEGFFLAVLRKPEEAEETDGGSHFPKKKKPKGETAASSVSKENLAVARGWLTTSDKYDLLVNGAVITAFPALFLDDLAMLRSSLRIVQAGTEVAEVKGKDLIPAHGLAMSRLLETSLFPTEELTYEQAIAYLRKEAITLSPSVPRGYVLVTYKKTPLGFVKNIGNRANNLYPQEWRIRSGYLPEDIRTL